MDKKIQSGTNEGLTNRKPSAIVGGVGKEQDEEMEDKIQKAFNDSVGAILTYLDEANVGFAIKKAVRSELWELCDRKIMPLLKGIGNEQDPTDARFNR